MVKKKKVTKAVNFTEENSYKDTCFFLNFNRMEYRIIKRYIVENFRDKIKLDVKGSRNIDTGKKEVTRAVNFTGENIRSYLFLKF